MASEESMTTDYTAPDYPNGQGFEVEILADSIPQGAADHARLTTFRLRYPRFIHAEVMTHRQFSRNSASSRARSMLKRIEEIAKDPVMPLVYQRDCRGMHGREEMVEDDRRNAWGFWIEAKEEAAYSADSLARLGLHKQWTNRLLEPFAWHEIILTTCAPGLWNFFRQRLPPDAQPEIRRLAALMWDAYDESTPRELEPWDWHSPMHHDPMVSAGRCARISYGAMDENSVDEDRKLAQRLISLGHWSPFEHQARHHPGSSRHDGRCGNLTPPWAQHRKLFAKEYRSDRCDRMGRSV